MKMYHIFPEDTALALARKIIGMEWLAGRARTEGLTGTVKQNREILSEPAL